MTTTPSPGDLARRGRPPALTARPVGTSRRAMPTPSKPKPAAVPAAVPFRERWESALLLSRTLHRNAKAIGLTIATFADWQTGRIGDLDHPSIVRLSYASGMATGNVRVSLRVLAGTGWIDRVDVASDEYPSRIRLLIPTEARARQ